MNENEVHLMCNADDEIDLDDMNAAWERIKAAQVFLDPRTTTLDGQGLENTPGGDSDVEHVVPCTRLVLMSDTHGAHRQVMLPQGDVLIHGGDFTKMGEEGTVRDLDAYFHDAKSNHKFEQVICIAGNHDITFHSDFYLSNWQRFPMQQRGNRVEKKPIIKLDHEAIQASLKNCTYLQDSSCTLYSNATCRIYGSPWSPYFFDWAFNLQRGPLEIGKVWEQIPTDTDVLITHGPPLGRGDWTVNKMHAGCLDLLLQVQHRVKPRLHVFGHIHEGYGCSFDGYTLYVNASNLDLSYQPIHPCIVVDLPHDQSKPAMIVQPQCPIQNARQLEAWLLESDGIYASLAASVKESDEEQKLLLPSGNALLQASAIMEICDALRLHRDLEAQKLWRRALAELYAQSFVRQTA